MDFVRRRRRADARADDAIRLNAQSEINGQNGAASRQVAERDKEKSMNRIVVLSGAGISAESGLQTFRGAGGLWEGRRVEDVATPAAWAANPGLVLEFYNQRRRAVRAAEPNAAHRELVDLERAYDVRIVTQNVDDLHERAGNARRIVVNPDASAATTGPDFEVVAEHATVGVPKVVTDLLVGKGA